MQAPAAIGRSVLPAGASGAATGCGVGCGAVRAARIAAAILGYIRPKTGRRTVVFTMVVTR
ncbi:hypothetical protein [Nonomuraea sp. NPDC049625]|uniref:hypothetical protein n=1 Tax=Nonomuraea sp. NPDC049625 TaxID=3155775 RepID=UPI003428EA07